MIKILFIILLCPVFGLLFSESIETGSQTISASYIFIASFLWVTLLVRFLVMRGINQSYRFRAVSFLLRIPGILWDLFCLVMLLIKYFTGVFNHSLNQLDSVQSSLFMLIPVYFSILLISRIIWLVKTIMGKTVLDFTLPIGG